MIASITAFASSVTDRSSIVSTEDYVTSCQGLKLVTLLTLKKRVCYIASLRAIANPIHQTNSLALHHQPLSIVILLLLDLNFQESVSTTELFNDLLYPHDACTFRWSTSRSCSTDVDSHLAIRLNFASISCRYDHSLSSLRSSKAPP